LVSQDKMQIDVFKSEGEDMWSIKRCEAKDKMLKLDSIDLKIAFEMIYRNVNFEA